MRPAIHRPGQAAGVALVVSLLELVLAGVDDDSVVGDVVDGVVDGVLPFDGVVPFDDVVLADFASARLSVR